MRTVAERTAHALSMVGSRSLSGMCEMFTRQCFGFPARYGSALLAWNDTERRHADIYNAPEGVPLFANLHPANPNYRFGHVWYSLGGGYSVTTSAGPGRSIAKVRTRDLVAAWGMTPLGWTEDYHGQTVWTPPTKNPSTLPTQNGLDMTITLSDIARVVREETSEVVRKANNVNNTALHNAFRTEAQKAAETVIARVESLGGGTLSAADVERIRVAILGDRHPKTPGTDLRGAVTTTMLDLKEVLAEVKQQRAISESLAGAVAALDGGESFDFEKFVASIEDANRRIAEEVADGFFGDLTADVNLTIGRQEATA